MVYGFRYCYRINWEVKTDDGSIHDRDNGYNWNAAQTQFIAQLNIDYFGNQTDWRLPTKKELHTIVNLEAYNPSIDTHYFPGTQNIGYWSSTTGIRADQAWFTDFSNGAGTWYWKAAGGYRVSAEEGDPVEYNLIDNGDGTVTDTKNGLMWQQDHAGPMNWESALAYCEKLTLNGHNDWRLPNSIELRSVVDYTKTNPAIDKTLFPNALSGFYWTSTTDLDDVSKGRVIYFWYGNDDAGIKSDDYYVRAVRVAPTNPSLKDTHPPAGAVHAYPNIIWPPNNKRVKISLSGKIYDEMSAAKDKAGIGVHSAYLVINSNETITLRDEFIDLIDSEGCFSVEIDVLADKGAEYTVELHSSDTNSNGMNWGLIDTAVIRVASNMGK